MKQGKKKPEPSTYPDFIYPAENISAFHLSLNSFVLSLKNGEIVRFAPKDTEAFLLWLKSHHVKDIR